MNAKEWRKWVEHYIHKRLGKWSIEADNLIADLEAAEATAKRERERAERAEALNVELRRIHADTIEAATDPASQARIEVLEDCVRLWLEDVDALAMDTCWCIPKSPDHAEVKCPPCLARALLAPASDAEPPIKNTTRYIQDEWGDYWTCEECKVDLCYEADGPEENGVKSCSACGRRVVEFVRPKPEDDEDEMASAESSGEHGAENPEAREGEV